MMAAGSQILTICLCQGESVEEKQPLTYQAPLVSGRSKHEQNADHAERDPCEEAERDLFFEKDDGQDE